MKTEQPSVRISEFVDTKMGQRVNLREPDPKTIWIEDIAYGLARLRRLSTTMFNHYLMTQHCCWVAEYVGRATDDSLTTLYALLYKAYAAYTGDIMLPINQMHKESLYMLPSQQIVQDAIYAACRIPPPPEATIELIQHASLQALSVESAFLVRDHGYRWDLPSFDSIAKEMFHLTSLQPEISQANFETSCSLLLADIDADKASQDKETAA